MLGRLFPESVFARKLSPTAERRLRLAQARAEEAVIRAHVDNALMFVDTLAEDLPFDRAIETYIRVLGIPEPLASVVATRALVVLGQDLVPFRRRAREGDVNEENDQRPRLRLEDAARSRAGGWGSRCPAPARPSPPRPPGASPGRTAASPDKASRRS